MNALAIRIARNLASLLATLYEIRNLLNTLDDFEAKITKGKCACESQKAIAHKLIVLFGIKVDNN